MARQWRIQYPGALYHVLSRGNDRQNIFLSDKDRYAFFDLLAQVSDRYAIIICAYVLMGNHYHLLVKITEPNLSKAMQWLGTAYTRRFHVHNHTSGHLFQGRYKSILVENDAYLLRLSCYIHRNPLRAGLVELLADYPWSSYRYYAYKKEAPKWLQTDLILNQLSVENRHAAYRKKVQQYSDEKSSIWEDVTHGLIFGSQIFLDQLKARYLQGVKNAELPQHNRLLLDTDLETISQRAAHAFGLDLKTIRGKKRIDPGDKVQRDMLIYYLWETGRLSNQRIANLLGLTYSSISRRVSLYKEAMASDKKIESSYRFAKSQIKV